MAHKAASKRSEHELKRLIEEAVTEECRLAGRGLWFCVDKLEVHGHPPEKIVVWATLHFLPEGSPFCCGEPDCALGILGKPFCLREEQERVSEHVRQAMGLTQPLVLDFGWPIAANSSGEPKRHHIAVNYHDGVEFKYDHENWLVIVQDLKDVGIIFQPGLSDAEVERVERQFGFRFPSDLKAFLQTALPCGERFPEWRTGQFTELKGRMDWPADGMCFDIEHDDFWMDGWGPRPTSLDEAFSIARQQVAAAPVLIPIYSHRYIPDRPHLAWNPVFSVYQTDIIYYGVDLLDYFANEFKIAKSTHCHTTPRPIEFWGEIVS